MDKANKNAPLFPQMVVSTKKAAPLLLHVPLEWGIYSTHASNDYLKKNQYLTKSTLHSWVTAINLTYYKAVSSTNV